MEETVVIHLRLPAGVVEALRRYAGEKYGARKLALSLAAAELVRVGLAALRSGGTAVTAAVAQGAAPPDLEERLLNLEKRLRELEELYAELAKVAAALEERVAAPQPAEPQGAAAAVPEEEKPEKRERRRGRSALDILREKGFEEEAELAKKVKNVKTVLARLAEEGAVLIRTPKGFVAVHPQLWEQLRRDLELCKPTDLTPLEGKVRELYLLLAKRGLIAHSAEKGWRLPEALSGEGALKALEAEPAAAPPQQGEGEGSGGGGGATFVFKCPQCAAELRAASPEAAAEEASKHVWKEHGILLATDSLYRYITRVS
ncbi:MAG: hypothetical protein QW230_02530 [Thermofilum sp.]